MIAYSYDPTTGRLSGPLNCDPSPLDVEGAYLVPAFAVIDVPPAPAEGEAAYWTGEAWELRPEGTPEPETPAPATDAEILAGFASTVQVQLDAQARAWGYDGILSAVSYAGETSVPRFAAEGAALRAWRSAVWAACYEVLAEVQAQSRPRPTVAELLAELPAAPARPSV